MTWYRAQFSTRRHLIASIIAFLAVAALIGSNAIASNDGARLVERDPRAVKIATAVMEKMGGEQSWNNTRYLRWRFFGRRVHFWDKWSGNIRIETDERLFLMNINSMAGRVWDNGQEITEREPLQEALVSGHRIWVNDSYWMFMPYKLLDPGVSLRYAGEKPMADGRQADALELTFDSVGYTPDNRYLVYVAKDTGLVEQWQYFEKATDEEPGFTNPWTDWQQYGEILLSGSRGDDPGSDTDWEIAVYEQLPRSVFTSPEPVSID